jgi:DNA-binding CsgD family transcriptional regulator
MTFHNKEAKLLQVPDHVPYNRLFSGLNESKIGVVICDRHFRYQAMNESLAKMNNLSIKEHLGRSFHQVLGELSEEIVPHYETVFSTGKPKFNLEIAGKLLKRSSTSRWIQNIFPIKDSRGRITQVGSLVTEIGQAHMNRHSIPGPSSTANPARKADSLRESSHKSVILSEREREVLRLLAEGKSNKEVSSVLDISVRTVESFRATLMLKLQAPSFAHLVHYAIRNSIVKL